MITSTLVYRLWRLHKMAWLGAPPADVALATSDLGDNIVTLAKMAHGTASQNIAYDGSGVPVDVALASSGLTSIQVFTSTGTWTRPTGIILVKVTVIGGGGGGGGGVSDSCIGVPGGGGGGAIEVIDVSSTSSETVTIGAAGAAGSASGNGGAGGTSSFGSFCSATGGAGGVAGATSGTTKMGTVGGAGSGGDININGSPSNGLKSFNDGHTRPWAKGGTSAFGFGFGGNTTNTCVVATAAVGYGGGGGAGSHNTGTGAAGAVGTAGVVVVEEYK
jgi:hypothetical protein